MHIRDDPAAQAVAELIERLGFSTQGDGFAAGLNPAQWAALRYFRRANRFSRTVSAFAAYHGTSRGTASQTVKSLIGKGLLRREQDARDRRSFVLTPSPPGVRLLRDDPRARLARAAGCLGRRERAQVTSGLETVLAALVEERELAVFGVCRGCRHLCAGPCGDAHKRGRPRCALAGEELRVTELDALCVDYQAPPAAPAPADDGNRTHTQTQLQEKQP